MFTNSHPQPCTKMYSFFKLNHMGIMSYCIHMYKRILRNIQRYIKTVQKNIIYGYIQKKLVKVNLCYK